MIGFLRTSVFCLPILLLSMPALAQYSGNIPPGAVMGNPQTTPHPAAPTAPGQLQIAVMPTSPNVPTDHLVAGNGGTLLKDSGLSIQANGGLVGAISSTSGASPIGAAGSYIFTDTNTTGPTNAGAGSFLMETDISGASHNGDRSAMVTRLKQAGAVQTQSFPGSNYSGANIYSEMNYNVGGTNSAVLANSIGQNFGANIIAQLGPTATNWNANVGLEVDAQGSAGASVYEQIGIYSVKIGPVVGTVDIALAVDAQPGALWKTGLDLGPRSNPYPTNGTLIACTSCNGPVTNGIYMPNVAFSGEALHLGPAIAVSGGGNLTIGGGFFTVAAGTLHVAQGGNGDMFIMGGPGGQIANQVSVISSATGGAAAVVATGSDPSIDLNLGPKGLGHINLTGRVNLINVINGGGASVNSVCVDVGGNIVIKPGAC